MSSSDHVRLEIDGAVAIVTMAKPPHNLLNGEFIEALIDAYESAADAGGRVILLRSDMKHFSAGADTDGFGGDDNGPSSSRVQGAAETLDRLEGVGLPTIAAVHGLALGGGFEIALACDFIICGASARLGLVETTLGLIPLLGGVQRVVQRAGTARGKEIAIFGRRHDPVLLEKWGVVNLVVADDELENASLSWARQLATGATVAYGQVKKLAEVAANEGVHAADLQQEAIAAPVWASNDLQTGLTALAESGAWFSHIRGIMTKPFAKGTSQAPLAGVKILDFTRVLAGPHCTKTLRDLGADVVKVEPPAPDTGRSGQPHVGAMSLYFAQQNSGKRAISLDLNFVEAQTSSGSWQQRQTSLSRTSDREPSTVSDWALRISS